ncbi:hypothetical protein WDW86_14450 [Bdellovibrionota bacterium FG-2]
MKGETLSTPSAKKPRKTRIKAELSVFDDEMTAKFNPNDFIPDAPTHARVPEARLVPAPVEARTVPAQMEARPPIAAPVVAPTPPPKTAPTFECTLEPSEIVLSLVEQNKENNSAKVRFYNPTSRELCAVLRTPLPPMQAWQLTLSGKRLQPVLISKGALSVSVKPGSLMRVELLFANC